VSGVSLLLRFIFCLVDRDSDKLSHLPQPQIQIVRRAYSSIEHVLAGFDIPACAVAFTGKNVFALKSFSECVTSRVIHVAREHRSFHYEDRLLKYVSRGFALEIPELDVSRIPSNLQSQGVASVLCLPQLNRVARTVDKDSGDGTFMSRSRGLLRLVLFDQAMSSIRGLCMLCFRLHIYCRWGSEVR